jgi:hypothetical protein
MISAKGRISIIILLTLSIVFLPISAYTSQTLLLRNVIELNLTAASLGILSTLNIYYFIGLSAVLILLVLSFIYYRSNTLTIISVFVAILYFVDYPLLLSPFPPYLADATEFSTESLAVSIFEYSSITKWLYNGGAYPVAFIWNAITSMILATQPIYLSSCYGIFEPIALGLISYIVGRRMISDNKNVALAPLAVLIFTALIWSYQFHFSPQDFNIVILMLTAPLLPMVVNGDLRATILISLVTITLTLGHQTEDPILLATLLSLLFARIIKRYKGIRTLVFTTSVVIGISFVMYSSYVIPINISVISNLFSSSAIERFVNILIGKISHSVYFALTNYGSVYPLRSIIYRYELYGGYAIALFELISIVTLYILLWFRESSNYKQAYTSLALGGLLVVALITLATSTYSNRIAIYSAPVLSGLLLPYLLRVRKYVRYLIISVLVMLSFIGLVFSGSTIYWDYSGGNPITYRSYLLIYSLGYHYNLGSIYNTNWLTGYELLSLEAKISAIGRYSLFDYNKNDLIYIANNINMVKYKSTLDKLINISIIYNDGMNLISPDVQWA